ncbi:SpoIIE family protein phosphatase [Streptomyces sp. NBC_01803]|uniref:SpoIIE family protein phosphatase n=1 Tax=Streptomyces sp. NBC_01803 TaxID=2975946 RepID=UPI002DD991CF|nr:SpoIIE family protein phosphatase [Streptomyces sp. NBC_01803]WSA46951.1 SpoIIE family protein phosphatase [Streptomyces sp. NBC_01803]
MSERKRASAAVPLPEDWPAPAGTCLAENGMGFYDWDLDSGLLHLDDIALAIFGLPPDEYDSRPERLSAHIPDAEAARLDAVMNRAFGDGSERCGTYFRVRRRDGETRWAHTQCRIHRDEHGRPRRVLGLVRDAEDELAEAVDRDVLDEERRHRARLVESASNALAEARTVPDVAEALSRLSGLRRLGVIEVMVGLVETGRIHLVSGPANEHRVAELEYTRIDEPYPMSEAVRTGRPCFVTSREEFAARFPALWRHIAHRNVAAAAYLPLVAQGAPLGGLGLLYRSKADFPRDERELLAALATGVSQSLQRATLLEQEHDLAENLQQAMLPRKVPDVPGTAIAVRYRSARLGRDIGGDWYDVIPLPGGRVAAVIGDVQGHDTHATTVMGQLRIVLRAYAADGHPADEVMGRASAFLGDLETERFATCLYAEHDPATGMLRLVRAGHLPPLVRGALGACRLLDVDGTLPLGLAGVGLERYPVRELTLGPGETLLMCTDGLIERPGWDPDEGMRLLADTLCRGPEDLESLADFMSEVRGPGPDEDDMALVLLRRVGTGPPADGAQGRSSAHTVQPAF